MNNHIVCPTCKNKIPLSEAFAHELREQLRAQAIEYTKKKDLEFRQKLEEERLKNQKEKEEIQKKIESTLKEKLESEMRLKFEDSKNEREELKKQNRELQSQLLELTKTLRQLKADSEQKELELEKKLAQEQEKIKIEMKARAEEEFKFKLLEKEKQLEDTKKALEEAKRKTEQVSQQLQGEVLELELEHVLKAEFPYDEIRPVAKGIRGGDVVQRVRNSSGKLCGSIMWESKRTKAWSAEWVRKLKDDQRQVKAEMAVIVSEVLPQDIKRFAEHEGIWVTEFSCALNLAHVLRKSLLEIALVKSSSEGKNEKMEVLYNYIYGTEFRQRIEAIMEAFGSLQDNIEKEKRWFTQKWAKEERDIRKVLDNTLGLSGDLQSITGKQLPDVEQIGMLDDGSERTFDN